VLGDEPVEQRRFRPDRFGSSQSAETVLIRERPPDSRRKVKMHFLFRNDRCYGGSRFTSLSCSGKKRCKRFGSYDSRGRLAGKRHISERPAVIDERAEALTVRPAKPPACAEDFIR
jgi:hypothetical protein